MGSTSSKSAANIATTVVTQAVMKNITNCVINASQDQSITVSNTVGDVSIRNVLMSQSASIDSKCMQQTLQNADVQNKIANDAVQSADTKTQALLGLLSGSSSSETIVNAKTTIKNMFTTENINKTITNIRQRQSINVTSTVGNVVIENVSMEQGVQMAAQAFVDATQISKALADVSNKLDQSSSSNSQGIFDSIADTFTEYGYIIGIVVIIAVVLAGGLLIVKWYMSGSTDASLLDIGNEASNMTGYKSAQTAKQGGYLGGLMANSVM